MWLGGYRVSETLSLKMCSVFRDGVPVERIGIAPRHLKGNYGTTRWVPVLPELHRALAAYLGWLRRRFELSPTAPLFLSRKSHADGAPRALARESARRILHGAFRKAGIENDGRLGTHTLRKSWARRLFAASNNNLLIVRRGLNHANLSTTQAYLDVDESAVEAAIRKCDVSRRPRRRVQCKDDGVVVPFNVAPRAAETAQG